MKKIYIILLSFLFLFQNVNAQSLSVLINRSNTFLSSLSANQKDVVQYSFEDKLRPNWTNLPVGLKPREGVKYRELSAESKVAIHRVLTTLFSSQSYLKINSIMSLDDILNIICKERFESGQINERQYRRMLDLERDNFFISFWGKPDLNAPWTFKLGGFHIGIHTAVLDGKISLSPIFIATDPSEVLSEIAGIRVLNKEGNYEFLLLNTLTDPQKKVVIKNADLDANQKGILRHLIKGYLNNKEFGEANKAFQKIELAGFDNVYFAWIGKQVSRVNHYIISIKL
jgi:hypothetical protein